MWHRARQIIVFLLLGAAVTVAIAWAAVLLDQYSSGLQRGAETLNADFLWVLDRSEGWITTWVTSEAVQPGLWLAQTADSSLRSRTLAPEWADLREPPPAKTCGRHVIARGWPMRALWNEHWWDYGSLGGARFGRRGIIGGPSGNRGPRYDNATAVPLRPIWPGFAVNTFTFAAAMWLFAAGAREIRRKRRIRRNLCPACAYPVGTSNVCSECGRPCIKRVVTEISTLPSALLSTTGAQLIQRMARSSPLSRFRC